MHPARRVRRIELRLDGGRNSFSIDLPDEQAGQHAAEELPGRDGAEFEGRNCRRAAFVAPEDLIDICDWPPTCPDNRSTNYSPVR